MLGYDLMDAKRKRRKCEVRNEDERRKLKTYEARIEE